MVNERLPPICNVFLLILSYFLLGKNKTKATIFGSLLLPGLIELTSYINVWLELDTSQLLLSSIFGGVMYGFGLGMIFKAGFALKNSSFISKIWKFWYSLNDSSSDPNVSSWIMFNLLFL